ncbi:MAG: tRNA 2-thiouridine(34) synthase MnmA [Candidatus Omnitrophica bacterium]|nr:tRNA 2-thiouridine(34) synthase MnmA [Candidatus Omnitrophota bacterium]
MPEAVIVAMSGGVDSSVAAYLLKRQGLRVVGMTLKTWDKEQCDSVPKTQSCCSVRDVEDARMAAEQLDIPFYVVEASGDFRSNVMDYFVDSYARGLTPNPCVVCNRQIKTGMLMEKARALGVQRLATGHYAGIVRDEKSGRYAVRQSADAEKDQSYVLFQLGQEQLSAMVLPMGDLPKPEVRRLAREAGLEVADKPESMELCFIPDGDTQGFLRKRIPEAFTAGEIVDRGGRVLGQHQGTGAYTVGQRKGLGLSHPTPLYVLEIDSARNRVVVGEELELAAGSCRVRDIHWMALAGLTQPVEAQVKVRYRGGKLPARLVPDGEAVRVEFAEAVPGGVTPGQAAVFYDGAGVVLGGGWIR